ncbi:MAG: flagellar biosynthesis/type III secretory pathway protein FliH [Kiritimatiellia bacterium]|jgi:flagellar biosynthesis/type III secretory pathway protein FliH
MGEFRSLFGSPKDRFQPLFGGKSGSDGDFTPLGLSLVPTPGSELAADPEALMEEARQQGADAARAELDEEMTELRAQLAALEGAMDDVARLRSEQIRTAADDVGKLVLALAKRVVGDSLALHPGALSSVLEDALSLMPDEDDLCIRVAPSDVERVKAALSPRRKNQVVADPNVSQGCSIEGRQVSIDATLSSALEGAAVAVQAWVESHG